MSSISALPYDILQRILDDLDDSSTMATYCLLSRDINGPASSKLYNRLRVNFMGSRGTIERVSSMLRAASLPLNCHRVKTVILRGVPSDGLVPLEQHLVLLALQEFNCLENFTVQTEGQLDTYWTDDASILSLFAHLSRITSLRSLTIDPLPCIPHIGNVLTLFDHNSLRELCLVDRFENPLHSIPVDFSLSLTRLQVRVRDYWMLDVMPTLPSVRKFRNLKSLTLGFANLNNSHEMLESLALLPHLEDLCLEFSNGLEAFGIPLSERPIFPNETGLATSLQLPPPRNLKSFTLRHKDPYHRETIIDAPRLCKLIKHIISLSSIEELSFQRPFSYTRTLNPNPKQSWDILIDHLADKHAKSLRYLDLEAGFVRKTAMEILLRKCNRLEELIVATSPGSLMTLIRNSSTVPRLVRACFEFRTHKREGWSSRRLSRSFSLYEATDIMRATRLRRLTINDDKWVASWVRDGDGALEYCLEEVGVDTHMYGGN
ncbi:hypothetical protein V5O48_011176 [Marasmius crinis-equi]|uniref:F-box domain-containing protein n=1 Tax=Marasmius crinis-equi TaxID=585013 RepID=A0ABR3F6G1_9AGAR